MSPAPAPDGTALRTALWRALHVRADAPPHVFTDEVGLRLAGVDEGWPRRPDMDPQRTARSRASIVARARLVEDLVLEEVARGTGQYVLLGAGLDTFAWRRPEVASRLRLFEVDQPGASAWKAQRLGELGLGVPAWLRLVPVDFEAGGSWRARIAEAGFDASRPAVVSSTGVAMYLTLEAIRATLGDAAELAPGSVLAMSFMLPLELCEPEERPGLQATQRFAAQAGHPFRSLLAPAELVALAREAGFGEVEHVSAATLGARYFAGRADGLRPSSAEELIVARR